MIYDALSRYDVDEGGLSASRSDIPEPTLYDVYWVREGDTLENIASRKMGNPRRYWEIADINPHVKFPLAIGVGTRLRLPR